MLLPKTSRLKPNALKQGKKDTVIKNKPTPTGRFNPDSSRVQIKMQEEHIERGVILVVEGDEGVRNTLEKMLLKLEYQAVLAPNAKQGLDLLRKRRFDLVLLDLGTCGMNGWLSFASKAKFLWPQTPVCLMTSWGEGEIRPVLNSHAAEAALFKPFTLEELRETIRKLLGQKEQ
ncbi:MAG: response regulator [Deltaproteobacteria bacterium]|nr:response regulator [Deltaproteobacteria bacterium]